MKKIVALFVCLLAVSLSVRADDDRPIQFEQLPSKAQAFVKEHFPQQYVKTNYAGQKVLKIEKEDRGGYEIKLSGGLELGFDKRFQLIDIDN